MNQSTLLAVGILRRCWCSGSVSIKRLRYCKANAYIYLACRPAENHGEAAAFLASGNLEVQKQ